MFKHCSCITLQIMRDELIFTWKSINIHIYLYWLLFYIWSHHMKRENIFIFYLFPQPVPSNLCPFPILDRHTCTRARMSRSCWPCHRARLPLSLVTCQWEPLPLLLDGEDPSGPRQQNYPVWIRISAPIGAWKCSYLPPVWDTMMDRPTYQLTNRPTNQPTLGSKWTLSIICYW